MDIAVAVADWPTFERLTRGWLREAPRMHSRCRPLAPLSRWMSSRTAESKRSTGASSFPMTTSSTPSASRRSSTPPRPCGYPAVSMSVYRPSPVSSSSRSLPGRTDDCRAAERGRPRRDHRMVRRGGLPRRPVRRRRSPGPVRLRHRAECRAPPRNPYPRLADGCSRISQPRFRPPRLALRGRGAAAQPARVLPVLGEGAATVPVPACASGGTSWSDLPRGRRGARCSRSSSGRAQIGRQATGLFCAPMMHPTFATRV